MQRNSVIVIVVVTFAAALIISFMGGALLTQSDKDKIDQMVKFDEAKEQKLNEQIDGLKFCKLSDYSEYSLLKKIKAVLKDKSNWACSYMKLYTEPMTIAELELLGDYLLKQRQQQTSIYYSEHGLKIEIFWNIDVAKECIAKNYSGGTQFYNSYLEKGKRASYSAQLGEPNTLDDEGLYAFLRKSDLFLCYPWVNSARYDVNSQTLYAETSVRCMTELVFNTFCLLGDGLRGCLFDRLPNLKVIEVTYTDRKNNKIGEATFDFRYWAKMIQIKSTEIDDEFNNEWEALLLKYHSKLITEKEFYAQSEHIDKRYQEAQANYYQKKWLELFPFIKDFSLDKELPLNSEAFNF